MNVIKIESEKRTPYVYLNYDEGVLEMKGRSMPEDAVGFYQPIINWFKEYAKNPIREVF